MDLRDEVAQLNGVGHVLPLISTRSRSGGTSHSAEVVRGGEARRSHPRTGSLGLLTSYLANDWPQEVRPRVHANTSMPPVYHSRGVGVHEIMQMRSGQWEKRLKLLSELEQSTQARLRPRPLQYARSQGGRLFATSTRSRPAGGWPRSGDSGHRPLMRI